MSDTILINLRLCFFFRCMKSMPIFIITSTGNYVISVFRHLHFSNAM